MPDKKQNRNAATKEAAALKAQEVALHKKLENAYYLPDTELSVDGKSFKNILKTLANVLKNTTTFVYKDGVFVGEGLNQIDVFSLYRSLLTENLQKAVDSGVATMPEELKDQPVDFNQVVYADDAVIPFTGAQFLAFRDALERIINKNTSDVVNPKGEVTGSTLNSSVAVITKIYSFLFYEWHAKNVASGKTVKNEEYVAYFENLRKQVEQEKITSGYVAVAENDLQSTPQPTDEVTTRDFTSAEIDSSDTKEESTPTMQG